jgi:hypothetical protein
MHHLRVRIAGRQQVHQGADRCREGVVGGRGVADDNTRRARESRVPTIAEADQRNPTFRRALHNLNSDGQPGGSCTTKCSPAAMPSGRSAGTRSASA